MHKLVVWTLLAFVLSAGTAGEADALERFDAGAGGLQDGSAYNSSELCLLKWNRTHTLRTDALFKKANGRYKKKILLVHVGKTAGGTIHDLLKIKHLNFEQVHFHAVDELMLRSRDAILLSLRQPVDRLISAFNYQNSASRAPGVFDLFYKGCFDHVEQYANALTEDTECGRRARRGVGHMELDTCAYLGGVVDTLKRLQSKVFAIEINSVIEDLNVISARLKWGVEFESSLHKHSYPHSDNITSISTAAMMRLSGYVEVIGEGALYRELIRLFKVS